MSTARRWLSTGAGIQNHFLESGQYLSTGLGWLSTGQTHLSTAWGLSTDDPHLLTAAKSTSRNGLTTTLSVLSMGPMDLNMNNIN
ncbi:hypothetical protein Taro_014762 [Colocasia esculenta]|uniref:Uncharacterized protein n=1 Tax=Colocasia esculenta TaxID=4460 RepID=A0A843UR50_COLES|nr:hypothetical protein [Colocasia esculenta]